MLICMLKVVKKVIKSDAEWKAALSREPGAYESTRLKIDENEGEGRE
jgi:hypothetical protein